MAPATDASAGQRWWNWIFSIAAVLAVMIAVTLLFEVNRSIHDRINALASANSDSMQWSLAQSDVELLALQAAISNQIAYPSAPISTVRTRFDIFYSRARTLSISPLFTKVREEPEMGVVLKSIDDYLSQAVTLIDSDDTALRGALPRLQAMTEAIRTDVRSFNMQGIRVLSRISDLQRAQTADTLNLAAILIFTFISVLILMLGLLVYLFKNSRRRAIDESQIKARMAAIVSTSLDAVVAVNKSGAIIDFNGAAEQIFGYDRKEAIGQQLEDLIVPSHLKDAHLNGMERYRTTGERHVIGKGRVQLEARKKSGEIFPVELSIAKAESGEGEIFVSFLRDISARIAAEQELIKTRDEAVAGEKAKADLVAVMSHEMRTPLNGMLGTLQLIDTANLSRKYKEYIEIIRASGDLLLHHVDDVLEVSRAESGKMEISKTVFSLPMLVSEMVESQRGGAEHRGNILTQTVEMSCGGYVLGDPTRIRQIILNLIGNAIKFTRDGSIVVEAKRIPKTDIVEFRVTDTGLGIAEQDRARIFEEFVTLDTSYSRGFGGTGLGLAIVKRIVEAMGGEVGLDNSKEVGSDFWVRLPLPDQHGQIATTEPESPQEWTPNTPNSMLPMKVLVVEDNRINRFVIRELLEKDGHEVEEAIDGQEGLRCALTKTFDLIFMDISMPVLDGLEATEAIRKAEPEGSRVPIIALTAHAMPSEKDRFLAAGMNDILIKPISLDKLRATLKRISESKAQRINDIAKETSNSLLPVVDQNHLNELTSALGSEQTDTLIADFLNEMEKDIAGIIESIEAGDSPEGLRKKTHRTAGSAALLGAEALRAALKNLEDQLSEGLSSDAISSRDIEFAWSRTAAELRSEVQPN